MIVKSRIKRLESERKRRPAGVSVHTIEVIDPDTGEVADVLTLPPAGVKSDLTPATAGARSSTLESAN